MKKCIYIFLICLLMACERQPLRVSPMTHGQVVMIHSANRHYDRNAPVPGFYYPENFIDDKQGLKELMAYINDTIRKEVPFDCYMSHSANICKGNRGLEFEGGEAYTEKENYTIYVYYNETDSLYFNTFWTWSKYKKWGRPSNKGTFEQNCDYSYHLTSQDSVEVVIFNYESLNMDEFQKFLNVAFYERGRKTDKKSNIFKLKNPVTHQIECVVKFYEGYYYRDVFTIDIL